MADYIAAQISIGGMIPHHLVADLCEAISQEGLSLEWGDCDFKPATAQELLEARSAVQGVVVLCLCDHQARWGEFPDLKAFLEEHNIPFDRFHEGKYEFSPDSGSSARAQAAGTSM